MLAVRTPRALTFSLRTLSSTSTNRDLVNWPIPQQRNVNQLKYLDHPNRNIDYYESFVDPFPLAPRFADKDASLNELRAKAASAGNWSELSVKEQRKLYDGHFRMPLHYYTLTNDEWKLYPGIWAWQIAIILCVFTYYTYMMDVQHPEHQNDEHYINEWWKKSLQWNSGPYSGNASKYDYENGCWREQNCIEKAVGGIPFFGWFYDYFASLVVINEAKPNDGKQMGFRWLNKPENQHLRSW